MDIPLYWSAIIGFALINVLLTIAALLIYFERRVAGFIQNRVGPNRVGPMGLLQPFADVLKLVMKEDIRPGAASGFIHALAPTIMVVVSMTAIAVIPLAQGIVLVDVNVAILLFLALTSLSVYGITLGGWSSNSKYSLLGGLRSAAQMISYELPMGLAVLSVVVISQSLSLTEIVQQQSNWWGFGWYAIKNPIGFVIFTTTAFAETNRLPFDLPEAEQELVGGYHTEYSGMKFGMFFLAEYVNVFMASVIITTLFLGGYVVPFQPLVADFLVNQGLEWLLIVLQMLTLLIKTAFLVFVFIWVRWTLPRFKYNQIMNLGWNKMLPLALANVVLVAGGVYLVTVLG